MTRLIAIILTYNEAEHITACIESAQFADSVVVFDSFSTDNTIELAQKAGARVLQRRFDNYAFQRNAALEAVQDEADWVLFVDADERVTPEMAIEVREVIEKAGYAGWRIPRYNSIFGHIMKAAGWYPDYQTRLLKVGAARFDPERIVHEVPLLDEVQGTLKNHFFHYNYKNRAHFAAKQHKYTAYDAQILYEQGIRAKPQNYILQPLRQFWWRFVTLKGYLDGGMGLYLAVVMGWYEYRKYVLLGRLWKNHPNKQHHDAL